MCIKADTSLLSFICKWITAAVPPTQSLFWLECKLSRWKPKNSAATVLFEIQMHSFALPGSSSPAFDSFLITVRVCSENGKMLGEKNALYQGKDAYSSGTPCGRKFYWRAPTQSFSCHSLKQCHCRSLLNPECGLWRSLQGLSSCRRKWCTCVSVLSPERV